MTSKSKRMAEIFNSSPVEPDKKKRSLEKRLQEDVGTLEDQQRAVTPQQWRFIHELVDGEGKQTLKQAAIAAGHPENKANKLAHELTDPRQNPQVVAAIQQYRKDLAEKYGTSLDRHLRDLQSIRDAALDAGNYGAAVTAEYRRGQALGTIYVDRKEIRHGTIDSMSVDEVRRKLEEIKAMYGGPPPQQIIDVTPEDLEDDPEVESEEPSIIEQFRDVEKARVSAAPEAEGEPAERSDHEAGEPGGAGTTRLPDCDPERGFRHGRAEGGEPGPQGPIESAPSSLQPEARDDGDASVDSGAVPSEKHHQTH